VNTSREPRCIVSLTYDGALPCHFESVAPLLEEHDMRGTFYVPCSPSFFDHVESWREVAAQGHELGNHSVFLSGSGREPAHVTYDIGRYTARRWTDEVRLANSILSLVDGRSSRSFGHTCSRNLVGPGPSPVPVAKLAKGNFVAARGGAGPAPVMLDDIDWFDLGVHAADGATFEELRDRIEEMSRDGGGWLILSMHSVGPRDHALHIGEDDHARLVEWLADRQETLWTAPVRAVAEALKRAPRRVLISPS
jgi:peptidoglycan-N-acetylglucosamine deacetylase